MGAPYIYDISRLRVNIMYISGNRKGKVKGKQKTLSMQSGVYWGCIH